MGDTKRRRGPGPGDEPTTRTKPEKARNTLEEVTGLEGVRSGNRIILEKGKHYIVDRIVEEDVLVPRESVLTINQAVVKAHIILEDMASLDLAGSFVSPGEKFFETVDSLADYIRANPEVASPPVERVDAAATAAVGGVEATAGAFAKESQDAGAAAGVDVTAVVTEAQDAAGAAKDKIEATVAEAEAPLKVTRVESIMKATMTVPAGEHVIAESVMTSRITIEKGAKFEAEDSLKSVFIVEDGAELVLDAAQKSKVYLIGSAKFSCKTNKSSVIENVASLGDVPAETEAKPAAKKRAAKTEAPVDSDGDKQRQEALAKKFTDLGQQTRVVVTLNGEPRDMVYMRIESSADEGPVLVAMDWKKGNIDNYPLKDVADFEVWRPSPEELSRQEALMTRFDSVPKGAELHLTFTSGHTREGILFGGVKRSTEGMNSNILCGHTMENVQEGSGLEAISVEDISDFTFSDAHAKVDGAPINVEAPAETAEPPADLPVAERRRESVFSDVPPADALQEFAPGAGTDAADLTGLTEVSEKLEAGDFNPGDKVKWDNKGEEAFGLVIGPEEVTVRGKPVQKVRVVKTFSGRKTKTELVFYPHELTKLPAEAAKAESADIKDFKVDDKVGWMYHDKATDTDRREIGVVVGIKNGKLLVKKLNRSGKPTGKEMFKSPSELTILPEAPVEVEPSAEELVRMKKEIGEMQDRINGLLVKAPYNDEQKRVYSLFLNVSGRYDETPDNPRTIATTHDALLNKIIAPLERLIADAEGSATGPAEDGAKPEPGAPSPDAANPAEQAEKRDRVILVAGEISDNTNKIREMVDAVKDEIPEDKYKFMLHWDEKYKLAIGELSDLLAAGNMDGALATAEHWLALTASDLRSYPEVIEGWKKELAESKKGGEPAKPEQAVDTETTEKRNRALTLAGEISRDARLIMDTIEAAISDLSEEDFNHILDLDRQYNEAARKITELVDKDKVDEALAMAEEYAEATSNDLKNCPYYIENCRRGWTEPLVGPDGGTTSPLEAETTEKRNRALTLAGEISRDAALIMETIDAARADLSQEDYDHILNLDRQYNEAARKINELIGDNKVDEALAMAEEYAEATSNDLKNCPYYIENCRRGWAEPLVGPDGGTTPPPEVVAGADAAGHAASEGEPEAPIGGGDPLVEPFLTEEEIEALFSGDASHPVVTTPGTEKTIRQLLNEAKLAHQMTGEVGFATAHEIAGFAEYQAQFASIETARALMGTVLKEILELNNQAALSPDHDPDRDDAINERVAYISTETGLTIREVMGILQKQDSMIHELADADASRGKSRGRVLAGIGARLALYASAGVASAYFSLGMAGGAGIAGARFLDRIVTDKVKGKKVAEAEKKIREQLRDGNMDPRLAERMIAELAVCQQRRIDGTTDLNIENFVATNATELAVEGEGQDALVRAMEALNASDAVSAKMAQGSLYDKVANSSLFQFIDRVILAGGRNATERGTVTAAFSVLGLVGRQAAGVRNVLMGVAGWRLGDAAGKWLLKDKAAQDRSELENLTVRDAEEMVARVEALNKESETSIVSSIASKKTARLMIRVAGFAVGAALPEVMAHLTGQDQAHADSNLHGEVDKLFAGKSPADKKAAEDILGMLQEKDPKSAAALLTQLENSKLSADDRVGLLKEFGSHHTSGTASAAVAESPQLRPEGMTSQQHLHERVGQLFSDKAPEDQAKLESVLADLQKGNSKDTAVLLSQLENKNLSSADRIGLIDKFSQTHAPAAAESVAAATPSGRTEVPSGKIELKHPGLEELGREKPASIPEGKLGLHGADYRPHEDLGGKFKIHDAFTEGKSGGAPDVHQVELATIHKGEGIEHALIRQLRNEPAKFGFKGDAHDATAVRAWAGGEAHRLAIKAGFVDAQSGQEIRVGSAGIDKAAYVLEGDASSGVKVHEYLGGQEKGVHAAAADFKSAKFEGTDKQDFEYVQGGKGDAAHAVASAHQEAGSVAPAKAPEIQNSGVPTEVPAEAPAAQPEWVSNPAINKELQSSLGMSGDAKFTLMGEGQEHLTPQFADMNDQFGHPFKLYGVDSNGDGKIDVVSAFCDGKLAGRIDIHDGDIDHAVRILESQCASDTDMNLARTAEGLSLSKGQFADLIVKAQSAGIKGFSPESGLVSGSPLEKVVGALDHGGKLSLLQREDGVFDQGQLTVLKEIMRTSADGQRIQPILETTKALHWGVDAEVGLAKVLMQPGDKAPLREVFGAAMIHKDTDISFASHKIVLHHIGAGNGERVAINFNDGKIHVGGTVLGGGKKFALDDLKGVVQHLNSKFHWTDIPIKKTK